MRAFLCLAVALPLVVAAANAQEPSPTPDTATPEPIATVEATRIAATETTTEAASTPAETREPSSTPSPVVVTDATIAGRLVEDLDGNGEGDVADRAPVSTLVQLVVWSRLPPGVPGLVPIDVNGDGVVSAKDTFVVSILTAPDGTFEFTRLPSGDYTFVAFWSGGFVDGGVRAAPHMFRAVFRVNDDGSIGSPDPLPATWPGSPDEPFDPMVDGTVIGSVPELLLLKLKDPDVLPYPVSTGGGPAISGQGTADVAVALGLESASVLPDTGLNRRSSQLFEYAVLSTALAAALAAAGVLTMRKKGQ